MHMKTDIAKKEAAIKLRKKGKSIRDIEKILGSPRSTLSGWLRDVKLSKKQKEQLHRRWLSALVKARLKASEVNKNERLERMKKIEESTKQFMANIKINKTLCELIFATFYLAEGSRTKGRVEIANTDPKILTSFLKLFRYLYLHEKSRFRCHLNLRMDQSEEKIKNYWSKILHIPKSQFIKTSFERRSTTATFKKYKGVCTVYYCDTDLQKRILTVGEEILQKINNNLQKGGWRNG